MARVSSRVFGTRNSARTFYLFTRRGELEQVHVDSPIVDELTAQGAKCIGMLRMVRVGGVTKDIYMDMDGQRISYDEVTNELIRAACAWLGKDHVAAAVE